MTPPLHLVRWGIPLKLPHAAGRLLREGIIAAAAALGPGTIEALAQEHSSPVHTATQENAARAKWVLEDGGDAEMPPFSLAPAIQEAAIALEILDPRERRYVLTRPEDFSSDLRLLQRRYREFLGAPPLHDHMRFPDRAVIANFLAFNRGYRDFLARGRPLALHRMEQLQEAIRETDRLYAIWDTIRDARCDYYYVTVRRQALQRSRDMMGEQNYFTGQLPPHVPLWRFQRIED